jgi:hypothetical protein
MASPTRHRPRRTLTALLVAIALPVGATLASCSDDDQAAGSPPSTSSTSTPTTTEAPSDDATVELLDAGDEPRRVVRLAFESGATATVIHATTLSVEATSGDRRQRLTPPSVRQRVRYEITDADATSATVEATIEAVEVDDDELAADLGALVGVQARYRLDDRGRVSDVTFDVPEDASDAVDEQVRQVLGRPGALGSPLPAEPIGVGARWRTTLVQTAGTVTTTVVAIVTATDLTDAVLASEQTLELTTVGEGAGPSLQGRGSATTDLQGLASRWQSTVAGEQEVEADGPDGTTTVTQTVELTQSARPTGAS